MLIVGAGGVSCSVLHVHINNIIPTHIRIAIAMGTSAARACLILYSSLFIPLLVCIHLVGLAY